MQFKVNIKQIRSYRHDFLDEPQIVRGYWSFTNSLPYIVVTTGQQVGGGGDHTHQQVGGGAGHT